MKAARYVGLPCVSAVLLAAVSLIIVLSVAWIAIAYGLLRCPVYLLDFAVSTAPDSWAMSREAFVKILEQQVGPMGVHF
jgi:hypothetical protein